ncbi:MAG: uL30 family ribosomal protein, partial [Candidatus Diapherotrites archaeon]|nr:uL30 family ribosomal protein [Candidatus Diapherotrites archaeon]
MYVAIRVRGKVNVSPRIKKTLELLRLDRVNHLALVRKEQKGMLEKTQSFITFGE